MPPTAAVDVPVDEIRDYQRVNALVSGLLDRGGAHIRLRGVTGQRLLLCGLRGTWEACIELDGPAGPELAAGLNAPGLLILARHGADAAAGTLLRSGCLVLGGPIGDVLAYRQQGGLILATGPAGHRAGLEMRSGLLALLGPAGRLLAERQRGGEILAPHPDPGPFVRRGHLGGRLHRSIDTADAAIRQDLRRCLDGLRRFFPDDQELHAGLARCMDLPFDRASL